MPTYKITAPDGRKFRVTGDRPPTQEELNNLIKSVPAKKVQPKPSVSGVVSPTSFEAPLRSGTTTTPTAQVAPRMAGGRQVDVPGQPLEMLAEAIGYVPAAIGNNALFRVPEMLGVLPKYENLSPGQQFAETAAALVPAGGAKVGLKKLENVITEKVRDIKPNAVRQFYGALVNAVSKNQKIASSKFGAELEKLVSENPDKLANLDEAFNLARIEKDLDPLIKSVSEGGIAPAFKNILEKNGGNLIEVQQAIGQLQNIVKGKASNPKYFALNELVSELKAAQADAFPQMAKAKEAYRKAVEPLNEIRRAMPKDRSAVGDTENFIRSGFKNSTTEQAISKTIPRKDYDKMNKWAQNQNRVDTLMNNWFVKLITGARSK